MTEKKIDTAAPPGETSPSDTESMIEKRAAARRRFLKRGAASGAILTFLHQRSYAWQTKTIYVSSATTCTSMHGTAGAATKMTDSVTGAKNVLRTPCTF
jgi:hypothetical protein